MIVPATRYKDPEAALAFLTGVIGLTEHLVVRDDAGRIQHVELSHGGGFFMLSPEGGGAFDAYMVPPREVGYRETTSVYVIVADVARRYETAVAAGAEILLPLKEEEYGGSSFTLRDPEGHVWSLGDYDPRAGH